MHPFFFRGFAWLSLVFVIFYHEVGKTLNFTWSHLFKKSANSSEFAYADKQNSLRKTMGVVCSNLAVGALSMMEELQKRKKADAEENPSDSQDCKKL